MVLLNLYMRLLKILVSNLVATSAMTAFSYLLSESADRNFKEPKLLGEIINKNRQTSYVLNSQNLGWLAHYLAGTAFVTVYDKIWCGSSNNANIKSGLLLGAISGVIGIVVWKTTLYLIPNKPSIPHRKFYLQLFPAHLVFGSCAAKTYQMVDGNQ